MARRWRTVACGVALACLASLAARAASDGDTASVGGTLRDRSGTPVAAASVRLVDRHSGRAATVLSADDGSWRIDDLAPGAFLVEVSKKGYLKLVPGDLEVAPGFASGVDFVLDRRGERSGDARTSAPRRQTMRRQTMQPSGEPSPPPLVRRSMEKLLPGAGPMARPLAASQPNKARTVLVDELGPALGIDAAAVVRTARGVPPADAASRLREADLARSAGRTAAARVAYRHLIEDDPGAVAPFVGLAECAIAEDRPAEGLGLLRQIALTLVRVGRFADAIAVLERALALAGDDADLFAALGQARVERLRHREAIPALERAIALGRHDLRTLLYLAAARWETGDMAASEAVFARAIELHGESFELLWRYGQFLLWQGRAGDAAEVLGRARGLRDDHVPMLFALARAEAEAGRIEPAIATYERVLDLAPNHGPARHALAMLKMRRKSAEPERAPQHAPSARTGRAITLVRIAPPGLDFRHDPGPAPERYMPEIMGSGLAWLDYDGDGWWDVYLVQSGVFPPDGGQRATNRLYRNLGTDADGVPRFEDVTERVGVGDRGFGFGAVAADVDGDGATDLVVTNFGADAYLHNRGDGTFEDQTARAGLARDGWSASAALADSDGDGDLDLYVARYIDYRDRQCTHRETGDPDYCDIDLFDGVADRFYRNETVGRARGDEPLFTERTAAAGLDAAVASRGLGVVWLDLDGDRAPDLYVANDLMPNFLWHANGDGTFEDSSLLSGAAVNWQGEVEAGMGVTTGDVDLDGDADLVVTNYDIETNTLYNNRGEMQFEDTATASGFGPPSFNLLGFGVLLADFDRDGDLDAYVADGHVIEHPYRKVVDFMQPDLLLAGDGRGGFTEQARIGPPTLGRGAALADVDNDGDPDVMVQNNRAAPHLLRNDVIAGRWLGVYLSGRPPNTEAVGARVILTVGARRLVRWVSAGGSYLSSSDRRLLFGWDDSAVAAALEVVWPSGHRSRLERPPSGRYIHLAEPGPLVQP